MKFEEVTIGDARLILGDCREVLDGIASVSVTITDPPYSARTHSKARTNKAETARSHYKQGASRFIDFASIDDDEFVVLARKLVEITDRWVVMTCDHRHAALTFDWPEHIRLGAWVKVGPMPQISGDRPGSGHESVLVLHRKGRTRWNRGGGAGVWTLPPCKGGTEVATQKPLRLLENFVSDFSEYGETILDPFMGSGTTGIAAIQAGRRFIGIEKEPKHFEAACRRIEQAHAQPRLFDAPEQAQRPEQAVML